MSFIMSVLKLFFGGIFNLAGFVFLVGGVIALFLIDPWWYGVIAIVIGVLFFSVGTALHMRA